ncbi:MAG: hypothetical protein ACREM3_13220 [Candidatus Rokuibacteriota bacterium]
MIAQSAGGTKTPAAASRRIGTGEGTAGRGDGMNPGSITGVSLNVDGGRLKSPW